MTADRAHALVDAFWGEADAEATWHVEVLDAHAAALAWVHQTTGSYPAAALVAQSLQEAADRLRDAAQDRDPRSVLVQVAAQTLAQDRSSAA